MGPSVILWAKLSKREDFYPPPLADPLNLPCKKQEILTAKLISLVLSIPRTALRSLRA